MKTIYKTIKYSLSLALVCIGMGSMAQTFSPGDTVCLHTTYRGTIQWQKSTDSTNWTPVSGGTSDTMCFVANASGWYRAMITEGTCNPVYSDTTMIQVKTSQLYTQNDTFVVPANVTSVRVLVVGGGGGAASSHYGGGGSGYVQTGTYSVTPGQKIPITVGMGGRKDTIAGNADNGCTSGTGSAFGTLASANGGQKPKYGSTWGGGDGGSGGGGAGNMGYGGNGGSGGLNGVNGKTYTGGTGQGAYTASLSMFTANTVTAGAGGLAGTSSHSGGGGAGGILINGTGPQGGDGVMTWGAKGGKGYGAGGGSGGYDSGTGYGLGGDGAPGVVYIEW